MSTHPDVDEAWVVATVRAFAEMLEAPEILTDLEKLLHRGAPVAGAKKKKARPRKR